MEYDNSPALASFKMGLDDSVELLEKVMNLDLGNDKERFIKQLGFLENLLRSLKGIRWDVGEELNLIYLEKRILKEKLQYKNYHIT